jgi:cyanophycin synthetase
LALAVKAAAVLRLDLAGIDLLLPNISLSWRDTGGAICEVNGQPQLSPHLHHELLPQLVPKQGRIPIVALSIPNDFSLDRSQVTDFLSSHGINVAWVSSTLSCMQALADPSVDAVIWQLKTMPSKHNAIPVDVLDLIIELADSETTLNIPVHSEHWPSIHQRSKSILRLQAAELTQHLQSFLLQVTSHDRH